MNMNKIVFLSLLLAFYIQPVFAQTDIKAEFEAYKAKKQKDFADYKSKKQREFDEYRRKKNEEFAEYVRKRWEGFNGLKPKPKPKDPEPVSEDPPPGL